jgi:hypothetical protein
MKSYIFIRKAIEDVFQAQGFLNRFGFFMSFGLIGSLLFLIFSYLLSQLYSLVLFLYVLVFILTVILQLALYKIAFKYSQNVMEARLQDYPLGFGELVGNWGLKLRLLWVRLVWSIPILVYLIVLLVLQVNFELTWQAILISLPLLIYMFFYETFFVNVSLYKLVRGKRWYQLFNLRDVLRVFRRFWVDYVIISGLAVVMNGLIGFVSVLISSIPLLSSINLLLQILLVSFLLVWQYLFIPHLQGQVWGRIGEIN